VKPEPLPPVNPELDPLKPEPLLPSIPPVPEVEPVVRVCCASERPGHARKTTTVRLKATQRPAWSTLRCIVVSFVSCRASSRFPYFLDRPEMAGSSVQSDSIKEIIDSEWGGCQE
jgi:hypothetical protein